MVSTEQKQDLIKAAIDARERAYCPYSKFRVGCAVFTDGGHIFRGCNIENVSYPCGWCAEISAIAAAVSQGHKKLTAVAVTTDSDDFISPCGRCRQAILEFASPEIVVYMVNKAGKEKAVKLDYLIPSGFNQDQLLLTTSTLPV